MAVGKRISFKKLAMVLSKAAKSFMGVVLSYAKRSKQRHEENSPFAIRYRAFRDLINCVNDGKPREEFFSIWCVDWSSIVIGENNSNTGKLCTFSFTLLNNYKRDLPPLEVFVKMYLNGFIRLTVNETEPLVKMERYQHPYNEIIRDEFLDAHYLIRKRDQLKVTTNKESNMVSLEFGIVNPILGGEVGEEEGGGSPRIFKLVLWCNHFRIETFLDDELVHTINYSGNFNFERVRPFVSRSGSDMKREESMRISNAKRLGETQSKVDNIYDQVEKKAGFTSYFGEIHGLFKEKRYHKRGWGVFETKIKESCGNEYINGGNIMEIVDSYDVYNKNSWYDVYDRYLDFKIYGPTCVGTDIRIHNTGRVYGASEHSTDLDLSEYSSSYRFYNLDVFAYKTNRPDALYGSVPLIMSTHIGKKAKYVSGMLWLNPSDTFMDFERKISEIQLKECYRKMHEIDVWWISETGVIDLVLMVSGSLDTFYYNYHLLTGFPILAPRFSFGKHQSKWSNYKDSDILELSSRFEANKIPLDSIWLDIEHLNKRQCFTWNKESFGSVPEMLGELEIKGRNLVVIADPHISIDENYHIYKKLQENSASNSNSESGENSRNPSYSWIRTRSEQRWKDFVGVCWPGKVKYPDFLNPKVRDLYSLFYTNNYYPVMNYSNIGFWIDMNEPSVFSSSELTLPKHSFHYNNIEHRQVHNLYGYYHLKTTFIGLVTSAAQRILLLNNISNTNDVVSSFNESHAVSTGASANENKNLNEKIRHDKAVLDLIKSGEKLVKEENLIELCNVIKNIQRPFILTRSFYIGSHCFGFTWTGDNRSDYDSFSAVISMNVTNSICGISYTGSDVGGFYGHPCECLFLNWHRIAIWLPFYRVHSHIDSPNREPWEFNSEILQSIRKQVQIRYELLPFWYTVSCHYSFSGKPILKPLDWFFFEFGGIEFAGKSKSILSVWENQSFILGDVFMIYNTLQNHCLCRNRTGTNANSKDNSGIYGKRGEREFDSLVRVQLQ
ncbi:alpha glucosidase-like family 31 glycosyl hydrolase [Cryptosporidium felis]|nr:alpha glucosidase-like family 31 glycosyl hydrolase [Cryptosporidium felis]